MGRALWLKARDILAGKDPDAKAPRKVRKRVAPISARRRKASLPYRKAVAEFLIANPRCQCGRPGCRRPSDDVHHTRGRAGPLLMDRRFWRALARPCHDWVGENIAEARSLGLICPEGLWNVPDRTTTNTT